MGGNSNIFIDFFVLFFKKNIFNDIDQKAWKTLCHCLHILWYYSRHKIISYYSADVSEQLEMTKNLDDDELLLDEDDDDDELLEIENECEKVTANICQRK